ncbi:hypothetical protein LTR86_007204 [Recurvomyces mirabilis]|nr:hypothetical protein LTR86_007204 [Recurvomyces mirabilis]
MAYKRQSSKKVKSGCTTCKRCSGYEIIRVAQPTNTTRDGTQLRWVRPALQAPYHSDKEKSAFLSFQSHVLQGLIGLFDSRVWSSHVLPIAASEPSVRHSVIALGCLQLYRHHADEADLQELALQHYGKAVHTLRCGMMRPERTSAQLCLVACLLFVVFEFQQHNWEMGLIHLQSGIELIKEIDPTSKKSSTLPKRPLEPLKEAFGRLDIQTCLFTSRQIQLVPAAEHAIMPQLPALSSFSNVQEASQLLEILLVAMQELTRAVKEQMTPSEDLSADVHADLQIQLTRQLVSLARWQQSMDTLWATLSSNQDRQAAKVLQVQHLSCKLVVSNSLSNGNESLWDGFLDDFTQLLGYAEDFIIMASTADKDSPAFTLDIGVIPALYFTAIKCRDPLLRRHATTLLRKCKSQEGPWYGPQQAQLAEQVIRLEESGLGEITKALQVPESSRLYQAWYDLRKNSRTLYCKRRCLEEDGRWVESVKVV